MALQSTVNIYHSIGVAGDRVSNNPIAYTPLNFLAGAPVTVGCFVWRDSNGNAVNTGSGKPMGIVERSYENLDYTLNSQGSLAIPAGGTLEIAVRGDFYVTNTGASANSIGNKAFASLTDGSVKFAAAGATVSGYIETDFVAKSVGAANELVIISNQ